MLTVTSVTPLSAPFLTLGFSDGASGAVDCSFLVGRGLGAALSDPEVFAQVRVDDESGTIVWPNGLDPAPELLRSHLTVASVDSAAA